MTARAGEVAAALADRAEEVCRVLLPGGAARHGEWVEASTRKGGLGDSLSVALSGPRRGLWHHRAAGAGGDLLDLAAYVHQTDTRGALDWARRFLGLDDGVAAPPPRRPAADPADDRARRRERRAWAWELWQQGRGVAGSPAETYLRRRGWRGPVPRVLRCHPGLKHPDDPHGRWPALLAAVQGPRGGFVGVWRIFLSPTGAEKAAVTPNKMGLGAVAGGAVRLFEPAPGRPLHLTEGVETGLAVRLAVAGAGVWACLSTAGLTGVVLPESAGEVVVCADNDPPDARGRRPGQDAAARAVARFRAEGRRATSVTPWAMGTDFADLVEAGER